MTGERGKPKGVLIGSKVVVFGRDDAKRVFSLGFFGKPISVRKPKSPEEVEPPLELSLIEATYLCENGELEVSSPDGEELDCENLKKIASELIREFGLIYPVYIKLRQAGLVIRSALKYGADFALYREAPGKEHAPYLLKVLDSTQSVDPGDLVGWGRVAHSVRKDLIIAISYGSRQSFIVFKWLRP